MTEELELNICADYLAGQSMKVVGLRYRIGAPTVLKVLRRRGCPTRTRLEAANLYWALPGVREKVSAARKGKPSGVEGKTWKIGRPVQRPNLRGALNPRWKGGVTALRSLIHGTFEYRAWRTAIFERDGYRCVLCDAQSCAGVPVILHADHIVSFSQIMARNEVWTVEAALHCAELWDLDNGRTLCRSCHRQTDNYGHKAAIENRSVA